MKAPDLPKDPSNADLAGAITAVHSCLHEQGAKVDQLVLDMSEIKPTVIGYERAVRSVKKWLFAASMAILTAIAGTIYQNSRLHVDTSDKVQQTAEALAIVNARAAAVDRAQQDERAAQLIANQVFIGAQLAALSKRVGLVDHAVKATR